MTSWVRLSFILFLLVGMVGAAGCRTIRPPAGVRPVVRTMVVTAYCKCGQCCEWKRDALYRPVVARGPNAGRPKAVGQTASGVPARAGTIAADEKLFPFGTVMYIEGYGYGCVEDRGRMITGDHIDVFFDLHRSAVNWGRRTIKVKVWYEPGSGPR